MLERLLIDIAAIATIFSLIFDVWKFFRLIRQRHKAGDVCENK